MTGFFAQLTEFQEYKNMQTVMGALNKVWLSNVMARAPGKATRVTAAVAYANNLDSFFEHCFANGLPLDFYGLLDEDCAVSIKVMEQLLAAGPSKVAARLIKGHFHSKIIWWHGYGVYIGSANLTSHAWFSNVECGVFLSEDEFIGTQIQVDLDVQLSYLKSCSAPISQELIRGMRSLRSYSDAADKAKRDLATKFEEITKTIPSHSGLAGPGGGINTTAFTSFTTEWAETLQTLRGLQRDFEALKLRPIWVAADANPTVHFDQFLHAYYYGRVRDARDRGESAKSTDLVNKAFLRNRGNRVAALEEAAEWWASLNEAPFGEYDFIHVTAPRLQAMFAPDRLKTWTVEDFKDVMYEVHAFKTHARQIRNRYFNLPAGHRESERERSDRLATWLWEQDREPDQHSPLELFQYLVWASYPANAEERLWNAIDDSKWRFDHLGASSLGEALGWARPDSYPPRNNRTNKALRSLGHDVILFSD